jgi:integrase
MASIVKRGRSWFCQVRRQGAPTLRKTFQTKKEAIDWAAAVEGRIVDGTLPRHEAMRHTFGEMVDRFQREVEPDKNTQRHLAWFCERLGPRRLSSITAADLNELKTELAQGSHLPGKARADGTKRTQAKLRSPATVNRYFTSLSRVYSKAANEWEWLDYSPMRRVPKLKEPRGRVRFLSDPERQSLLEACGADMDPLLYAFVVLALSTGARAGELQHLTWRDIDLKTGRGKLENTKNGERRAIAFRGHALQQLQVLAQVRRIDTPWIFPSASGTEPWNYRHAWYRALAASGVEDFRFHDIRHTAASYLAMNGASLPEIAAILGHKTLAMVQRYAHLSDSHISETVERMNQKIFG